MDRGSKTGKTRAQKEAYTRTIKTMGYENTVDDSLSFPSSDKPDEDISTPTSAVRRPVRTSEALQEHFSRNWINWAVGAVGAVLLFFVFNFNRDIGKIEGRIDGFEKGLDRDAAAIEKLEHKFHEKVDSYQNQLDKARLDIQQLDLRLQQKKK